MLGIFLSTVLCRLMVTCLTVALFWFIPLGAVGGPWSAKVLFSLELSNSLHYWFVLPSPPLPTVFFPAVGLLEAFFFVLYPFAHNSNLSSWLFTHSAFSSSVVFLGVQSYFRLCLFGFSDHFLIEFFGFFCCWAVWAVSIFWKLVPCW